MLFRFCLYGFLKNQEYFDPFLILALREKGLSFFTIGLLIAFREVCVNILEIPTGAIADVFGRRKSMIFGFAAYIVSFTLFGFASNLALLFGAMWFYAIGDAFRSGTHKSMIFTWLRLNGRESERTKIYGLTRSWSKIGSAVSVVLASVFVFVSSRYTDIFFYAIIPYVLSIVNMLGYPRELDGEREDISVRGAFLHVVESVKASAKAGPLRGLVVESMGFEGYFSMAKEYLQPVLKATALTAAAGWAFASGLAEPQQVALLVAPIYGVLHLMSAFASRNAFRLSGWANGDDAAARWMWIAFTTLFAVVAVAGWFGWNAALIVGFVLLYTLQNAWRPALVARINAAGDDSQAATVLSIENQAQRTVTMIAAPAMGLIIDTVIARGVGHPFWPLGIAGTVIGIGFVLRSLKRAASPELSTT